MENKHDFVFGINIPISRPTEQEMDAVSGNLETSFNELIKSGYMTTSEAVAYVKFATNLAAFVPFTLDGFLESYRANIKRLENIQESE